MPYLPSKNKLAEARRKGVNVPFSSLMKLYRNRFGIRLTPEPEKKEEPKEVKEFLNLRNQNIPAELPKPRPQNLIQPEVNVTQNRVTTELLRPSPENRQIAAFLGGNPEEVLKNMEIARRTA